MPSRPVDNRAEIPSAEACKRIGCSAMQLARFVADGSITRRREQPVGHCRVWYNAADVERVAATWTRRRSRSKKRVDFDAIVANERGKLSAKIVAMIMEQRSLSEICVACEAEPRLVQQIYEDLTLGMEGRKKMRERQLREAADRQDAKDRAQLQRLEARRQHQLKLEREKNRRAG